MHNRLLKTVISNRESVMGRVWKESWMTLLKYVFMCDLHAIKKMSIHDKIKEEYKKAAQEFPFLPLFNMWIKVN